jgi:hypothetical protein
LSKRGWHKLATVYLEQGMNKVVKVDNTDLETDKFLVSDAMMLLINRKLSPDVVVSVENEEIFSDLPVNFSVSQNYPNPFNPTTTVEYSISTSQHVTIKVYDTLGREVSTLIIRLIRQVFIKLISMDQI